GTVLIKRLDTETEMTDGGIVKPETAIQRSNRGEVKAIGSDEKEVKVGDVVVFTRYGGTETEIDGQELVIVNRKQIYWFERYATLSKVV
ncbi:MAG TPA: hypothetical protein VIJ14_10510, partial [Rhabdochlamydiaceae bacterium]